MSLSAIDIFLLDHYNNRLVNEPLSEYWQSNVGQDYKERLDWLCKNGYLEIGSAKDALHHLTIPDLKDILRDHKLKVSGKKDDIIQRILDNIPIEDYQENLPKIYVLSETGKTEVDSHADELNTIKSYGFVKEEPPVAQEEQPHTNNDTYNIANNIPGEDAPKKWYDKKWFMWCMLIFIWPIGLFFLYRHRNDYSIKKMARIAAGTFCVFIFLSAVSNSGNHQQNNQPAAQATEASTVSTDTAQTPKKYYGTTTSKQNTPKNEATTANDSSAKSAAASATAATASSAATTSASSKTAAAGTYNSEATYLGNPKKMIFHRPGCRTIKHPERFVSLGSRDEAVSSGYRPCGVCKP